MTIPDPNLIGFICPHCGGPITVRQMLEFQKDMLFKMALAKGIDISEEKLEQLSIQGAEMGQEIVRRQMRDAGMESDNAQQ